MEDLRAKYPGYFGAGLDAAAPAGGFPPEFWVVTACDPDGLPLDPARNEERTAALAAELVSLGFIHFAVTGYDPRPGETHREPGYGIVCDRAETLRLGREWRQIAVFHVIDGMVWLVFCGESEERFPLRSWEEMAGC